jgi:carbonic anhydrase
MYTTNSLKKLLKGMGIFNILAIVTLVFSQFPVVVVAYTNGSSNSTNGGSNGKKSVPLNLYTYTAGPYGPENWGKVWPTCSGSFQSPINFNSSYLLPNLHINKTGPTLLPGYENVKNISATEKSHGVEFGTAGAGFQQVDGETYLFKSTHIHCPSEHMIDGSRKYIHLCNDFLIIIASNSCYSKTCLDYDCEMHFVSKSASGKFSVIGVFLEVSNVPESLVGHLLMNTDASGSALPPVNLTPLKDLLDSSHVYWYHGGLTTPPCTEGVKFSIIQKPMPISLHEYSSIKDEYNARPTQMNAFIPGCKTK